ncbi:grpE protein homolog 2, mitochondrial [Discoglossus pictus]
MIVTGLRMGAAGLGLRTAADQLVTLLAPRARTYRSSACILSAAAQQRSAGDQTTVDDDRTPDQIDSYTVQTLEKKARKLEQEVRELKERCNRFMADSENIRRRTQKFVEDAKLFGIQHFCRDLVEVADILEKAMEHTAEEGMNDVLSQLDGKLQHVFVKHGLEKMTPLGEEYDPYSHEIVCHVPVMGAKPGTVASVRQDGYKLHGRTIRHAHVGLAVEAPE